MIPLNNLPGVKLPHAISKEKSAIHAGLRRLGFDPATGRSCKFITKDPAQLKEVETAMMAASDVWSDYNVLIVGETGTGKELLAEMIGERRALSGGTMQLLPFKPVNCAGFVDTLFESTLFGHVKGSFTGAVADSPGWLRSAEHGTVFLDEIGELPLSQQAKLLRAIQSRTVTPVGSMDLIPIHCRFVFGTNRNLPRMVAEGTFRADLYYRINQIVVRTFPLRDRPGDARLIAEDFIERKNFTELEPDFEIPMRWYSRGNVRELQTQLVRREMGMDTAEINKELALEDIEFNDKAT